MDETPCPEQEQVFQEFDKLYGTLKILTKTEKNINKLKCLIHNAEKKEQVCSITRSQTRDSEKPVRRSSSTVVISKVSRKYALMNRLPNDSVVSKTKNCPGWLLVIAEAYTAILQSFWEVREELKLICNKYKKQQNSYSNMCYRRSKNMNEEYTMEVAKSEERLNIYFGGQYQVLMEKINEYKQQLQKSTDKKERLASMCAQIHKELEGMFNKHSYIYSTFRYESDNSEGTNGRMRIYSDATIENEDNIKSLTCELNSLTTNAAELKTSQDLQVYHMTKDLRDLHCLYTEVLEKNNNLKSECSTTTEVVKQFSEIVNNLKSAKEKAIKTVCERERTMTRLTEELKILKVVNPKLLDNKKRLQEEYQSIYKNWTASKNKYKKELSFVTQESENINKVIFKEKKDFIVPLKIEINKYQENLQKITADCILFQDRQSIIEENELEAQEETFDLGELENKITHFIGSKKKKNGAPKKKRRLVMTPKKISRNISSSIPLPHSPLESVGDSSLAFQSVHRRHLPPFLTEEHGRERSENPLHQKHLRETPNILNIKMMTNHLLTVIETLRFRESELREEVSARHTQILPLQDGKFLMGMAYLNVAAQLPINILAKTRYLRPFAQQSPIRKKSTTIAKKKPQPEKVVQYLSKIPGDGGTKIVFADLLPSSKFSKTMFPTAPSAYVEIPARELCENFGKLLFL